MEEEWKPILSSKILDGDMSKQLYSWFGNYTIQLGWESKYQDQFIHFSRLV